MTAIMSLNGKIYRCALVAMMLAAGCSKPPSKGSAESSENMPQTTAASDPASSDPESADVTTYEHQTDTSPNANPTYEEINSQIEELTVETEMIALVTSNASHFPVSSEFHSVSAPLALALDPTALQGIYQPIFGAMPRAGSRTPWFAGPRASLRRNDNPTFRFFDPFEFRNLGGFYTDSVWDLAGSNFSMVTMRIQARPQLDSQYISAIRSFLGDACHNLIKSEMNAGESNPSNLLFTGLTPDHERARSFFSRLSGLNPADKVASIDAYLNAFNELLPEPLPKDPDDVQNALRIAYEHLCIALASDIRVITR